MYTYLYLYIHTRIIASYSRRPAAIFNVENFLMMTPQLGFPSIYIFISGILLF